MALEAKLKLQWVGAGLWEVLGCGPNEYCVCVCVREREREREFYQSK